MPCSPPPATSLKALLADVDPSIVAYLTKDMLLDSVSDFANFWTANEYERCLQQDVVAHVYVEPSKEVAKVQAARLCAAWSTARGLPRSAPRSESAVGPVDAPKAPAGFENVGHFELEKGFMWSKCAPLQDGRILFTPFNHPSVLLYEPGSKTWELVGNFSGDCKWSGCATLPSGKVVFVPQYSSVILIFDPRSKTWEEVPVDPAWQVSSEPGSKAPQPKFSDCVALSDGKVLFVPYYHTSIVLFDPATKTWEEVGRFEGKAKWNGCKILPDGRVIFIPFTHPSILIFDPRSRVWEMVGNFEGGFKWSGSELLPDGRVLFAPLKSASILLFNPADKSWEEVGNFGTGMKWNGCKLLPDGRAVFVPLDSAVVLVFDPRSKSSEEFAHGKARRMSTDCAVLPNGRVVFVPCSCHEIVLFSPGSPLKSKDRDIVVQDHEAPAGFESVGHFELEKGFMWSKCAPLQDGRILFTPFNHPSVLLYEPASKTWELVGNFSGDCKWSGCAALPSGKVVFVPQYSPVILIFDPKRKTWEEVPVDPAWLVSSEPGSKAPQPKFSDCVALSDGKVLFVPYYHPSIVIFDPATKTCEEVGRFEGKAKWNGCKILPDGRVIFIPFTHPSILIFDPRKRTWEMVGNFEGGFKWSGSELLPDGRVLFAPLKSASILLFNPADKSWEEVGDVGTGMKWNGCKLLPDGRAVFVPLDSKVVLVFDPRSKTFEEIAHGKARRMSTDCAILPNGRVVFVPCSCHEIVLFSPGSPLKQAATGALELPTATIKKGSEVLAGKTSFVTVAAADNGNLYCAPFSFDSVLVINPATGRSLTLGSLGAVAHKYATMVKHSNGKFYSPPFSAERALEINPAAGTACEIGGSLGTGHAKWECIVEADNGQLYCAPGNSHRVLKIDPATGSVEEFGQPIGDLGGGPSGHYTSIKKASNGKLYSAPLNATQVLMIDPAKGTIQEIGEKLGVGGGSCTPGVPGKGGPDSDKWWAMAQGENGKFYCPPCNGLRVLVIDPSTDEVYKIGPYFAGDSKWGGVAKAPNGKLYSPPRDAERVLMIDPKTDTVSEIGKSFGQGGDKWSSIVLARDGKFYCTPRGAKTILVIDPSTDTAEELPGPVGEGGRWQWMGSVASTDGSVYAPPCMTDRVLCIAPKASGPRRVLVTGSGGKTGSLTLAKMAKHGDLAAVGLARTEASAAQVRAATGAACLVCDVRDPNSAVAAMASVETLVILHSATPKMAGKGPTGAPLFAYPSGGEPEKVDWEGGKVLIDAAKRAGVKHIVYVSSMGGTQPEHFLNKIKTSASDGKTPSDGNIILWKRKAEMYLLDSGVPYTIIHPGGLLPHFGDEVVPDGQRQLEVGLDDALTNLPPTSRTIPRGDVAELVLQCVLDRETAVGRSFDVISHEPNPAKAWDKNLKTLLAGLGGKNTDYSKPDHPVVRG